MGLSSLLSKIIKYRPTDGLAPCTRWLDTSMQITTYVFKIGYGTCNDDTYHNGVKISMDYLLPNAFNDLNL